MLFWLTLDGQQTLELRLTLLQRERNRSVAALVDEHIRRLRWLTMKNEEATEKQAKRLVDVRDELHDLGERVDLVRETHGTAINAITAKVCLSLSKKREENTFFVVRDMCSV